jgi:hypothetical protein
VFECSYKLTAVFLRQSLFFGSSFSYANISPITSHSAQLCTLLSLLPSFTNPRRSLGGPALTTPDHAIRQHKQATARSHRRNCHATMIYDTVIIDRRRCCRSLHPAPSSARLSSRATMQPYSNESLISSTVPADATRGSFVQVSMHQPVVGER